MLDDQRLIWRLKQGDTEALRQVYLTHKDALMTLAFSLLHDVHAAEDVLHDVFISFAAAAARLQLRTSLRQYLTTSVVNRARDYYRRRKTQAAAPGEPEPEPRVSASPDETASLSEETRRLTSALALLPFEQREAVVLRVNAGMKFKEIAKVQNATVPTVQGRYRYGIDKLRALMGGGLES